VPLFANELGVTANPAVTVNVAVAVDTNEPVALLKAVIVTGPPTDCGATKVVVNEPVASVIAEPMYAEIPGHASEALTTVVPVDAGKP